MTNHSPLRPAVPDGDGTRRRGHGLRQTAVRWAKRLALGLAALGLLALLLRGWWPKPIVSDLGTVRRGPLSVDAEEDGRTRVRARHIVAAPVTGNLDRPILNVGDEVLAGAPVATIRPPISAILDARTRADTRARLSAALARGRQAVTTIARARTALAQAEADVQRARALTPVGVSRAEAERAERTEESARMELASAELAEAVAAAESQALRATLTTESDPAGTPLVVAAPAAGRVLKLTRESEGPIAAGATILEIGDPRDLEVVVPLLSADAARTSIGALASLEDWGGTGPLSGRVRRVEPAGTTRTSALGIEEQRVNVIVAIDDAPAALGDGFRARVRIELWRKEDAVAVPASALYRSERGWSVFVVRDGVARARSVEIGQRGRSDVQVLRGVEGGETVVLYPDERIHDGVAVEARW